MKRRLILTLAAVAAVGGSPFAASLAHAGEHGRGHERRGDGEWRGRGEGRGGGEWRRDNPPARGWDRDGPPGRGRYEERRAYPDDRLRAPGGYLPPSSRGAVIEDYGRYRLRPPPRGFAWVRMGNGYGLMSLGDGRVYDIIPY